MAGPTLYTTFTRDLKGIQNAIYVPRTVASNRAVIDNVFYPTNHQISKSDVEEDVKPSRTLKLDAIEADECADNTVHDEVVKLYSKER